ITVVVLAGCAKRPAMTAASAPAPSGAAQATAPPTTPPSATAPSTSAPPSSATTPATSGSQPSTGPGPAPTPPPASEVAAHPNLRDIYFDFDKYDIRPGDAKILDSNATWLKGNNNLVLIEGHCDERGTNEYNLALGERRAKATMNYLVSQGVQAGRITI